MNISPAIFSRLIEELSRGALFITWIIQTIFNGIIPLLMMLLLKSIKFQLWYLRV